MANDGLLDLSQPAPNRLILPEVGQSRRVMTEQKHSVGGIQGRKGRTNFRQVFLADFPPSLSFFRKRLGFIHRECQQRRSNSHQYIAPDKGLPEWRKSQFRLRPAPALKSQSTTSTEQTHLSQFVITVNTPQLLAKLRPKFAKADPGAVEGRVVGHTDKCAVARIVSIRDDKIRGDVPLQNSVEQVIVCEGIAQPDKVAKRSDTEAKEAVLDYPVFVSVAQLFLVAGIVDVADNENGSDLRHSDARLLSSKTEVSLRWQRAS